MAADGTASHMFSGHDPAPTVSLDSLTQDGEYTPVQKDQMDLASMVDCAFSMADWSANANATPSAGYALARSKPGSTPTTGLDAVDSTAADLMALDSMYTALSSLGFQDPSFRLNQVDSSVGSVHASPGVHASPVSTSHDDLHSGPQHRPLSCQVTGDCGDDKGGMCPRSPHAGPGQAEDMNTHSMAAAHSALIEMQNQGLSYQNIEELVQNIQNLLNCLREKQNVQNAMNKVHMDERLRQVVLQMMQSGNPQAAQEACIVSAALAAGGQFPGMPPPSSAPNEPQQAPGAPFQSPFSPMGVNASPHPLTPDSSPLPNMRSPVAHDSRRTSVPSMPNLGTPRHAHPGGPHDDPGYPFASPTVPSSHPRSLQPDLSPPPAPHMSFHTPSLTPRAGARPGPRPIQTVHTPSPPTPSPHTPHPPRTPHTPRVASGASGSRLRGMNVPTPQTPPTPRDLGSDALADHLPTTPTQRAFKAASMQGTPGFDAKVSSVSEPLPAPGSVRGGTGVFIPGLHRQPVDVQNAPMGGPGGGNASMNMGPGLSAPLSGSGRSGRNISPLSAPLSDIQYTGAYDSEQQISPDSLSPSAELSRVRSAAFSDARGLDKADRGERGPNPMMHAPMDDGYSGSLSIMNPPGFSGPMDPPAYSGSFFTQELPDEEESRDLSGSGPFRHMTCHSYAGGEVMRTMFSTDVTSRRPLDPTPGDMPSPASGGHRFLGSIRQGTSEPIMEAPIAEADANDRCSISASLSPNSGSTDNFHHATHSAPTPPPISQRAPQESLADALGHLSIPGGCSSASDKSRMQSRAPNTPKGGASPSPCTPSSAAGPASAIYRRNISDRGGSRAAGMPWPSTQHTPVTPQARPPSTSSLYPPPSALTPSRFDRLMPAGECVPLNVTHWTQDHSSVTIFLQLERFNPASLMVQIQQHMVVVMALNSDGPSHVFMMRPEHAVRVQGSKSRPQPGNGISIVLQKRSPGNVWTSFGIESTPKS